MKQRPDRPSNSWVLFDNCGEVPRVVAKETEGVMTVVDDALFQVILKNAEAL
jgi:hypothetical protein